MFRNELAPKTPGAHLSPLRLLLVLALTVFSVETLIMFAIDALPPMPEALSTIVDATLLVALIFPVFYFLVFRPLSLNVRELAVLEEARRATTPVRAAVRPR